MQIALLSCPRDHREGIGLPPPDIVCRKRGRGEPARRVKAFQLVREKAERDRWRPLTGEEGRGEYGDAGGVETRIKNSR